MTESPSVFFPSLSMEILWKLGAVSRVRYAAQKTRALDTAPTFQRNPTEKKAKGRSSDSRAPRLRKPAALQPPKLNPPTPSALAYCRQKLVLTMGSTVVRFLANWVVISPKPAEDFNQARVSGCDAATTMTVKLIRE